MGVGDKEQRKNKQEQQKGSSKNNNGALGFEWSPGRGEEVPAAYKPDL